MQSANQPERVGSGSTQRGLSRARIRATPAVEHGRRARGGVWHAQGGRCAQALRQGGQQRDRCPPATNTMCAAGCDPPNAQLPVSPTSFPVALSNASCEEGTSIALLHHKGTPMHTLLQHWTHFEDDPSIPSLQSQQHLCNWFLRSTLAPVTVGSPP